MFEVLIKINCPQCHSNKIVENGKQMNSTLNLLCRSCGKQFQALYKNKGAEPAVRRLILWLLECNNGIRDIDQVLQVSRNCVLKICLRMGI